MEGYGGSSLGFVDSESTISANENGKNAFSEIQTLLDTFKETLGTDTDNINTLKTEFDKYDVLIGERNKGE